MAKEKRFQFKLKINLWTVLLGFFILLFILPLFFSAIDMKGSSEKLDISQAVADIKEEKVEKILVEKERIVLTYKGGEVKYTVKEPNENFSDLLDKADIDPTKVNYSVTDQTLTKVFGEILSIVLPLGLMAAFFFFILRAQNKGAQDIFSFGRSRAKLFAKGKQSTTFEDVAGVEDAKKELEEVVDFLKNPAKYRRIGARTPKGVLLFGPAGVGKTLLARAVAGEAGVPFFSMAGSEFMEMLVGVGASRVRDLFGQAKASAPSIIFIDEIDAIGRPRGRGFMGGHDEREQTLNQILVEMDGFTPNDAVLVIAATNRGDLLDPALLRPGRFDRRVVLDMPDKAAILAARDNQTQIEEKDIEEAATKVKLGPAKKKLQTEEDRKITAYHEAGHAIVTHILPKMDPVHRISIVARGMSLGHTLIPPAADRTHETKSRIVEQITAMLGGRAAEEVVFDEMTSGAQNDISQATKLARAMVIEWGMSGLGPINLGPEMGLGDFGQLEWYEQSPVSQAMQEKVDNEVKKIVDSCYKEALKIIREKRKTLDNVVVKLMEKETLDKEEFEKIVGKKLSK